GWPRGAAIGRKRKRDETNGNEETHMMITRRDLAVALLASAATLAGTGVARLGAVPDVMGSTIFDWTQMTAKPNKTGEVRTVVQRPSATVGQREIHITTLNPGETPHAPHKHPDEELLIVKEG